MTELARRCEDAEGSSYSLDSEIDAYLGWSKVPNPTMAGGLIDIWASPEGSMVRRMGIPAYTSSLDAAMTLVPEGQKPNILQQAVSALNKKFSLHMCHWPADQSYTDWLARYVAAAALRAGGENG